MRRNAQAIQQTLGGKARKQQAKLFATLPSQIEQSRTHRNGNIQRSLVSQDATVASM
jgi:hypothetical protein